MRDLCLSGALERREPWGVWGGELFLQGVVIPRKRPRGRPRKNEQAAVSSGDRPADARHPSITESTSLNTQTRTETRP